MGHSFKSGRLLETGFKRTLVLFVVVTMLMLGLSLAGGPDPRTKIYILATKQTAESLSTLVEAKVSGELVFYTPEDEFNDLDVLVQTGTIRIILVADFPYSFQWEGQFQEFLDTTIIPVDQVIVVESFRNCRFASEIIDRLPQKTKIVSEVQICNEISGLVRYTGRSYSLYVFTVKAVAISSLVLVGVGAAFCSSRILEVGSRNTLRGITEGIFLGGLMFILIQGIYLISSMVLETPIALHTTGVQITAISFLGPFGGGTVPRILSAALGMYLGMLSVSRKVNARVSLVSISIVVLGLAVLNLWGIRTIGRHPVASCLLYFGYAIYNSVGIHNQEFSRGVMMIFVGLIPLGLVPRMKKSLQSVVSPVCIVVGSWGFMRVGDLRFETALWSFPPGIILGIYLSIFCFLVSALSNALPLRGFFVQAKKVIPHPILATHMAAIKQIDERT